MREWLKKMIPHDGFELFISALCITGLLFIWLIMFIIVKKIL